MASSKTFDLKLYCTCDGCKKKVKKVLKNDRGVVHSSEIDTNEGKVTISGTTDPHTLIAAFGKAGKNVELLTSEQFSSGENNQLQNMEIVPTKSAKGVLDSDHQRTIAELQQFSKNNQRSKLKGIVDYDALGMTTATKNQTSHEHDFELIKNYNKPFTCDECKEEGFGPRYRCKHCAHELHEKCKFPTPEISHEFLRGSTLKYLDQLPRKMSTKCCIACGRNICGSFYHDEEKRWSLHPCCCNLESKLCIDGVIFELRDKVLSKCMWCNKKGHKTNIPGWSYFSACKKYRFHVHCVTEMVHEAWKKGAIDKVDSVALEKMDLKLLRKNDGKGLKNIIWKTVKIFLKTIVGILFGDPSQIIASVLVQLITD
ncbi:uncharacterized protein LOC132270930 isoform X2 [Cornus florida]|uniref:uncharacterized protein LOC132270930 isoform X2 n=1 Tax=Cornus florida TaxID=4283 RepID=UPI0028982050|nr:uncharacterized protein LOC132270930 isoform X2 [Cornus florida]